MPTLNISNFTVLSTTSGLMPISGRVNSTDLNNILLHTIAITGETEKNAVPGTYTSITSGPLYQKAHMCSSYIKIINDYTINQGNDTIFVTDGIIRLIFLGGTTSASLSLLYGFASNLATTTEDIIWNVAFANGNAQTVGDYIDITLPDRTYYPNLYMTFILINDAWSSRTIVSGNICSITNLGFATFCIDPSKSSDDADMSHFINIQGSNNILGILTRLVILCEDWYMSTTDRDYNDFLFSISSRFIADTNTNDTNTK